MGVNVFLAGVVAWRFSGGSRTAGVATAVLVAANFNLLYVHGFVVTEPSCSPSSWAGSCCSIVC